MSKFNIGDTVEVIAGAYIGTIGKVVAYAVVYDVLIDSPPTGRQVYYDSELRLVDTTTPEPTGQTTAHEAIGIVTGPRREAYGHPRKNFKDIADGWSVILGHPVTPENVAMMMVWTKVCREVHTHGRDNLVDIIGYVLTREMLDEPEE